MRIESPCYDIGFPVMRLSFRVSYSRLLSPDYWYTFKFQFRAVCCLADFDLTSVDICMERHVNETSRPGTLSCIEKCEASNILLCLLVTVQIAGHSRGQESLLLSSSFVQVSNETGWVGWYLQWSEIRIKTSYKFNRHILKSHIKRIT